MKSVGATFVEEIVEYERPTHWAYTVLSGVPIRDHLATIELREVGTGTEVSWHLRATLKIPGVGRLMLPVFKAFIDQLLKAVTPSLNAAPEHDCARSDRHG